MPTEYLVAVDELEAQWATMIADDGSTYRVEVQRLPASVKEGMVLRVTLAADGSIDWSSATPDGAERDRRLTDARARLARLRDRSRQ